MNMQKIMQQAQKMQRELQNKKDIIAKEEFVGSNEWVDVTLNGKKELLSCKIKKDSILKDDIEVLEDFIVLAMRDALVKIDDEYNKQMGQYAGMLDGLM